MATDALLAALKSIADENGLDSIQLTFRNYTGAARAAGVAITFDDPQSGHGVLSASATGFDEAIAKALAGRLPPPAAEVAVQS